MPRYLSLFKCTAEGQEAVHEGEGMQRAKLL